MKLQRIMHAKLLSFTTKSPHLVVGGNIDVEPILALELAMGDTIDISFGGALGLHLTPSVGTDFLFRERFSTPGAFDFTFQYDNPEALFTNEYAYFPDFSLSGGVTVHVSHFGGGRTWFNIDPGVSATAVPELNSSVFVLVLNGTVMLLRRRSRKSQI
ncbi:MAG: hypothetical protein IT422_06730 [Pirellulaceae bacterium]|nr:hypothetical protein [Pirellulaceae bacterium]